MGKSRQPAVALGLLLLQVAWPARAETTLIRLDAPCPVTGTRLEDIAEILRAQLAPLPIAVRSPLEPAPKAPLEGQPATALDVLVDACHSTDAELEISVRYRGQERARRVDLGDVAINARSRTLALALAESVQQALEGREEDPGSAASDTAFSPAPVEGPVASSPTTVSTAPLAQALPPPTSPVKSTAPAEPPARATARSEPAGPAIAVSPLLRYAFKTSTPYPGLDTSAAVGRYGFHLRVLANRRQAENSAVWMGALLASVGVEWLRLTRVSVRSELEVGAALAAPMSDATSVAHAAMVPHAGGATYVRLQSSLAGHWFLESELGIGVASSLTAQAYHADLMSLSGVFVQTSFGVGWSDRPL